MKFFSNDPNGSGLELHDTAEAARLAAVSAIDAEREIAVSEREWSDDVDSIFWGQVIECAEEFDNDDEHHADYRLGSVAEPMVPLRTQLAAFASAMETTLKSHDDKGGWDDESTGWLWDRLMGEARELQTEVAHVDYAGMMREAVDVANFAMMIYDVAAIRAAREGAK